MDPRGAAGLSARPPADPAGALEALAARTGTPLPHLLAARERSAVRAREAVAALAAADTSPAQRTLDAAGSDPMAPPAGASVVVFGSWARGELTDGSDEDWAVLVVGDARVDDPAVEALAGAASALLGDAGAQGIFGRPIAADDLVANIGLDADTNTNATRRLLLLLESLELHGSARTAALEAILARYLATVDDFEPPRFLLNDVVRYWRTICVDFEGKRAQDGARNAKWATRSAKLRTSRKLLFAGGLVPLLLCDLLEREAMPGFLMRWLSAPPLDRLAAAGAWAGVPDAAARTAAAYDRWIGLVADPGVRAQLLALPYAERDGSALWHQVRAIGAEFERGLDALLFSPRLALLTRSHAIF